MVAQLLRAPIPAKPTAKQLRYRKALAASTGRSFTYPRTAREASQQIDLLKTNKAAATDQQRVWEDLSARRDRTHIRDTQERPRDATRIGDDEIGRLGLQRHLHRPAGRPPHRALKR